MYIHVPLLLHDWEGSGALLILCFHFLSKPLHNQAIIIVNVVIISLYTKSSDIIIIIGYQFILAFTIATLYDTKRIW